MPTSTGTAITMAYVGLGRYGSLRSGALIPTATRNPILWVASSRALAQAMQLALAVILARILSPHEFGLVAISVTLTGFMSIFTELGLNAAVVQRPKMDERYLSSAFWLNAVSGLLVGGLIASVAYPIGNLYGDNRLISIILVNSLQLPLSLGIVHLAILERAMAFRAVAIAEIAANSTGFLVTLILATNNQGAMSIVLGMLLSTCVLSVELIAITRWMPKCGPNRDDIRDLWSFGGPLALFNSVNYWARNADNLLLGLLAGPASLGQYSRAYMTMLSPIQFVIGVLSRVLLSQLSRLAHAQALMRAAYLRSLRVTVIIFAPISAVFVALGGPICTVMFGTNWGSAGTILSILGLSIVPQAIAGTCGVVYTATGHTRALFRRGLLNASIIVSCITIGCLLDLAEGAAWGYVIGTSIAFYQSVVQPWSYLNIRFLEALRAVQAPVFGGALSAAAIACLSQWRGPAGGGLAAAFYACLLALVYSGSAGVLDRQARGAIFRVVKHLSLLVR